MLIGRSAFEKIEKKNKWSYTTAKITKEQVLANLGQVVGVRNCRVGRGNLRQFVIFGARAKDRLQLRDWRRVEGPYMSHVTKGWKILNYTDNLQIILNVGTCTICSPYSHPQPCFEIIQKTTNLCVLLLLSET